MAESINKSKKSPASLILKSKEQTQMQSHNKENITKKKGIFFFLKQDSTLHETTQALPKPLSTRTFSRKIRVMKTVFGNEVPVAPCRAGAVGRGALAPGGFGGGRGPVPHMTAHAHSQGSSQGSPQRRKEQNPFALVLLHKFRERRLTHT